MIKTYKLFNEWRGRTLYGTTLTDAVNRAKKLQRPDVYRNGKLVEEGEWIDICEVKQVRNHNSTRGGYDYESVIFEAVDGRYLDVDARDVTDKVKGNRVD